jgi:hypothetical protein
MKSSPSKPGLSVQRVENKFMVVGFLPFLQFALCSKSWQDRERSWQDLAMTGTRPWHNHNHGKFLVKSWQ